VNSAPIGSVSPLGTFVSVSRQCVRAATDNVHESRGASVSMKYG
jgi:hypothetical protein